LKVRNAVHNYEASFGPVAHPIHRRLPTEVKEQVRGLTASGTAARIVVSTMRMESQQTIIAKDVYNIRAKIRKENLAGKTPIESLIAILKESDYVFNYRTDNIGRITHLFFAHPKSIELFNRYPHVLLLDCTYKTNKFKLLLLNIVGITCLNTTFHVAFCVVVVPVVPVACGMQEKRGKGLGGCLQATTPRHVSGTFFFCCL